MGTEREKKKKNQVHATDPVLESQVCEWSVRSSGEHKPKKQKTLTAYRIRSTATSIMQCCCYGREYMQKHASKLYQQAGRSISEHPLPSSASSLLFFTVTFC